MGLNTAISLICASPGCAFGLPGATEMSLGMEVAADSTSNRTSECPECPNIRRQSFKTAESEDETSFCWHLDGGNGDMKQLVQKIKSQTIKHADIGPFLQPLFGVVGLKCGCLF